VPVEPYVTDSNSEPEPARPMLMPEQIKKHTPIRETIRNQSSINMMTPTFKQHTTYRKVKSIDHHL
jgi:hypothetical protein